jgi:hypothetical protein
MAASSTTMMAVAAYSPTTTAAACISISVSVPSLFFIFHFYFSFFFNFFCLHFYSCKYFSSILMKKFGRHCASLQKKKCDFSAEFLKSSMTSLCNILMTAVFNWLLSEIQKSGKKKQGLTTYPLALVALLLKMHPDKHRAIEVHLVSFSEEVHT